jgi:hypothetical protein
MEDFANFDIEKKKIQKIHLQFCSTTEMNFKFYSDDYVYSEL